MVNQDFNTILDLIKAFPDEQTCIDHLEELRWNGNVVSPFDPYSKVYKCKGNKYRCKETGKYFNVKTGTLFDNTKIPLQKWFLAIWLITSHKKGISSLQLANDLGITQKSAWFLNHRIRNCYGLNDDEGKLSGHVEVDETYVGGKNKNRHADKKVGGSQGRSAKDKTPVVGLIKRGGKLIAKKVEDVSAKTLTPMVHQYVRVSTNVYTDEWGGYRSLNHLYNHMIVNHGQGEYVNGVAHTNTIEGFWSLLKRGIVGIYHYVSPTHLQKYVDEFAFRYNTRKFAGTQRINLLLSNTEHRLTYKQLING